MIKCRFWQRNRCSGTWLKTARHSLSSWNALFLAYLHELDQYKKWLRLLHWEFVWGLLGVTCYHLDLRDFNKVPNNRLVHMDKLFPILIMFMIRNRTITPNLSLFKLFAYIHLARNPRGRNSHFKIANLKQPLKKTKLLTSTLVTTR